MTDFGDLIYRANDGEGEIHIYQDRRFRYLTFGNQVEQSCLDLADPVRLEYVYTQAMLLAPLLQRETHRVVLLGLGGGSLARALRAVDRGLEIVAVERRAAVIEAAREYFQLPDDRRLTTVCDEAELFLSRDAAAGDLIFADLYLADGMYPRQVAEDFLALCRERLSGEGVLVVNQWASEFQASRLASARLHDAFDGRVLNLHVQGGNIIAFAFAGDLPGLRRDDFFDAAQALGLRIRIPLQRHARNLWRQNAETLGVGRFRRRR